MITCASIAPVQMALYFPKLPIEPVEDCRRRKRLPCFLR
jgi:hypothetical protein